MNNSDDDAGRADLPGEAPAIDGQLRHLQRELADLRALVTEQRQLLEGLREAQGAAGGAPAGGATSGSGWTRRGLLLGGLGAAAGAVASTAVAEPAAAASGAMQFGTVNNATTSSTTLVSSNGSRTIRCANTGNGTGIQAEAESGIALTAHSASGSSAIAAFGTAGLAIYGEATGRNTAIRGSTADGVGVGAIAGAGVAMLAESLSGASLRLASNHSTFPTSGVWSAGDMVVVNRGAVGFPAAEVWFCVQGGTPGSWRLLASPESAGAFVPIEPVRVYDSRWVSVPFVTSGVITPGAVRSISVATGRSSTGAVTQLNAVPPGATAVTMNVTVANTVDRGNIAIVPGNVTTSVTSSINWGTSGTVVANGITVQLNQANRTVNALGRSNNADLIIDVTGYYVAR